MEPPELMNAAPTAMRNFWLKLALGLALAASLAQPASAQTLKVTLLGTGNPRPSMERFGPSILVKGRPGKISVRLRPWRSATALPSQGRTDRRLVLNSSALRSHRGHSRPLAHQLGDGTQNSASGVGASGNSAYDVAPRTGVFLRYPHAAGRR